MSKMPLNEDAFVRALRDVETPPPPADLLARLEAPRRKPARLLLWALPATIATMITLALIPLFIAPPAVSLAQVAEAQSEQLYWTVKNTRIMKKGQQNFSTLSYRDGNRWRHGSTYGLGDRTVQVRHFPPYQNYVAIDGPYAVPMMDFRVDRLLRSGEKPKVERNVNWRGRVVHRFTINTTYRAGREETFDQVLLVDPKTSLPVYMRIMRDSNKWGDEWEFDFRKPAPSVFEYQVPEGAKTFDYRAIRKDLEASLAVAPIGALVVDETKRITLFVDPQAAAKIRNPANLTARGISGPVTGSIDEVILLRLRGAVRSDSAITVADKKWKLYSFSLPMPKWPQVKGLENLTTTTGTLESGAAKLPFKDIPVVKVGDTSSFLRPYAL